MPRFVNITMVLTVRETRHTLFMYFEALKASFATVNGDALLTMCGQELSVLLRPLIRAGNHVNTHIVGQNVRFTAGD